MKPSAAQNERGGGGGYSYFVSVLGLFSGLFSHFFPFSFLSYVEPLELYE